MPSCASASSLESINAGAEQMVRVAHKAAGVAAETASRGGWPAAAPFAGRAAGAAVAPPVLLSGPLPSLPPALLRRASMKALRPESEGHCAAADEDGPPSEGEEEGMMEEGEVEYDDEEHKAEVDENEEQDDEERRREE